MRFRYTRVFFSLTFVLTGWFPSEIRARSVSAGAAAHPEFETISIKPGDSTRPESSSVAPGGRFSANATLRRLVRFAFDLQDFQISGGPGWMDSTRFAIEATAPDSAHVSYDRAGMAVVGVMLQSVLADRFKLTAHRVTRQEPIYELVVIKDGPKLRESPNNPAGQVRIAPGQLTGTGAPMFLLAGQLSRQLGRPVVDKTGLTGEYDFTVTWQPDFDSGASKDATGTVPSPVNSDAASIFTAVQEIGLKLQSAKGPVDMLVIDRAEKPEPN
jgi:uncharacterized protein (TIGR03435 family)